MLRLLFWGSVLLLLSNRASFADDAMWQNMQACFDQPNINIFIGKVTLSSKIYASGIRVIPAFHPIVAIKGDVNLEPESAYNIRYDLIFRKDELWLVASRSQPVDPEACGAMRLTDEHGNADCLTWKKMKSAFAENQLGDIPAVCLR